MIRLTQKQEMCIPIVRLVFACSIALCTCALGQDNIVVNGSFEEPAVDESQLFDVTSQGVVGWEIASGSVDLNSTRWDPFHLDQSIDMVGVSLGTIEQTLKTQLGSLYSVSFYYANNPEIMTSAEVFGQLQIFGNSGVLFSTTFDHANSEPDDMNYDYFQGCFTSDTNECLLRIRAINSVGARGVVVDDVRIAPYLLGDANLDGEVNLLDVLPFVELVQTGGYSLEADINCDGSVDLFDVSPFVSLLSG